MMKNHISCVKTEVSSSEQTSFLFNSPDHIVSKFSEMKTSWSLAGSNEDILNKLSNSETIVDVFIEQDDM
jgi:hypothetical protein